MERKVQCEFSLRRTCNNKLIGARSFVSHGSSAKPQNSGGKFLPAFDDEGHGTHTSSIAAGNFVEGANVFGLANGTAVGIASLAHLAIYKVCSREACQQNSVLAAFDACYQRRCGCDLHVPWWITVDIFLQRCVGNCFFPSNATWDFR